MRLAESDKRLECLRQPRFSEFVDNSLASFHCLPAPLRRPCPAGSDYWWAGLRPAALRAAPGEVVLDDSGVEGDQARRLRVQFGLERCPVRVGLSLLDFRCLHRLCSLAPCFTDTIRLPLGAYHVNGLTPWGKINYTEGMTTTTKRRPGRPPKDKPNPDELRINLRVSPELRRRIRMAAAAADMGMGEWLKAAAQEKLERERECDIRA